ncbi:hypothetical protein BSKO_12254 [Bryopsis sp. KO-2023]|nr:hypothetical protein BSKO_12254 [Bryopsis sp. KO-2023]
MVLAPLTTPAHFTGRRSAPPVKGQAAPPSPTATSPRARLRAWGTHSSEDTTPSPGALHRSIFSLDPDQLAAMFLEEPDEQKVDENNTGPHIQEEPLLPHFEKAWDEVWAGASPKATRDRYVVVEHPGSGGQPSSPDVTQEATSNGGRHCRRFAAVGGGVLTAIFCLVRSRAAKKKQD